MRQRFLVGCAVALGMGVSTGAWAEIITFPVTFTGAEEAGAGDPDGVASGTISFDTDTNEVSWSFTYADIAAPTLMHIHNAPVGVNGGVFVGLGIATSGGPGTLIDSVATTAANIDAILSDPTDFYVNIHNGDFPGGAVRGQIPARYDLCMRGAFEVGAGDADGFGSGPLFVDTGSGEICWDFTYTNIAAPTLMHIHNAPAGSNGGVFVGLGVVTTGGPGTLTNMTTTSLANAATIVADPAGHYVNIHNGDFPGGALRGQLLPAPCPWDLSLNDCNVGSADLAVLLGNWTNPYGAADLANLIGNWGICPP